MNYKIFNYKSISIDFSVRISKGVIFKGNNKILWGGRVNRIDHIKSIIKLGDNVNIQQNCHITCLDSIIIGDNTALAANVTVTDIIHPYEDISIAPVYQTMTSKKVKIGSDCLILNNVVILPGSNIGNHNIIAANSVVCGLKTPSYCVIAGSPARIVKQYDHKNKKWISLSK